MGKLTKSSSTTKSNVVKHKLFKKKQKKNLVASNVSAKVLDIPYESATIAKTKKKKNRKTNKTSECSLPEIVAERKLDLKADSQDDANGLNLLEKQHNSEEESLSEFDMDSYPSDTESGLKANHLSAPLQDETSSSGDESVKSDNSEFDLDSYPSDTDEEEEKIQGLPVNIIPSAELEEKERRTIFVGNLPYSVERSELKKWFYKFGSVECVRLRSAPVSNPELPRKVAVIKKSFHESRSNIHAYVRFRSVEAAKNALQANGALFNGNILRIDSSKHEGSYDTKKGVFIGNLPFSLEEDALRNVFSGCGEIESVRIVRDKSTGVGKGFAYVNFKCTSSVPLALKLDGESIEKRKLRVKPLKYPKKNSRPVQTFFNKQTKTNKKFRNTGRKHGSKNNEVANKANNFQGEISKIRLKKKSKKSALQKKHEYMSQILTKKGKNQN